MHLGYNNYETSYTSYNAGGGGGGGGFMPDGSQNSPSRGRVSVYHRIFWDKTLTDWVVGECSRHAPPRNHKANPRCAT